MKDQILADLFDSMENAGVAVLSHSIKRNPVTIQSPRDDSLSQPAADSSLNSLSQPAAASSLGEAESEGFSHPFPIPHLTRVTGSFSCTTFHFPRYAKR